MGKLCFMMFLSALISACAENKAEDDESIESAGKTAKGSESTIALPFVATNSSSFEMGDEKNAKIVLDAWKAWQDNQFENARSLFADSVLIHFAEGHSFNGPADSFIEMGKNERSKYSTMKDTLIAWMSTRSKDKNENWVLVWGIEYSTDNKGKSDTTDLHEAWRIKDGKVDYMRQYAEPYR